MSATKTKAAPVGAVQSTLPKHNGSPISIEMVIEKECKGSVRYAAVEQNALVTNVYLDRRFDGVMPDKILVTVETA